MTGTSSPATAPEGPRAAFPRLLATTSPIGAGRPVNGRVQSVPERVGLPGYGLLPFRPRTHFSEAMALPRNTSPIRSLRRGFSRTCQLETFPETFPDDNWH